MYLAITVRFHGPTPTKPGRWVASAAGFRWTLNEPGYQPRGADQAAAEAAKVFADLQGWSGTWVGGWIGRGDSVAVFVRLLGHDLDTVFVVPPGR